MRPLRIAVIGAGVAGLAAATDLARSGCEVVVFERADTPGGKLRQIIIGASALDAGPTVFTLRRVFDELFYDAGDDFERRVTLVPAALLARHAWRDGGRLDLFADLERSTDAVGTLAGRRAAQAFLRFVADSKRIYTTLDQSFMRSPRPSPARLVSRVGLGPARGLWGIKPFTSLWHASGRYFEDARLRQLFARYATYCGSSPFHAPATLMLIAHAERSGVWYIRGGLFALARELAALAARQGAVFRYGTAVVRLETAHGRISGLVTQQGERIAVDAVVCNADTNALPAGLFGNAVRRAARPTAESSRSLSALTWNLLGSTRGFDLAHHSVFFCRDYRAEFVDLLQRRRMPRESTVYICAQDRCDGSPFTAQERLLCLVNAPPVGDRHPFAPAEIDACERQVFQFLEEFGLTVERQRRTTVATSPADFDRLFPGTGGALYGPASHGWMASFRRPGSRSTVAGLYLAGGSSHPGPGVPMAAMSGRLAAACVVADYGSTRRSRTTATHGGTSMP